MERWQNRVAVVTGASSGIGEAVAANLIEAGLVVVALARREERLRQNQKALPSNLQSHYHPLKCDLAKEDEVKKAFKWVDDNLGGTDILVNNAGIAHFGVGLADSDDSNAQLIRDLVNTNVTAVVYCVREAFNSMKRRNFDGQVIIVNSTAGHRIPVSKFKMNIYPATKFAVTAMVETYRQEFANAGTKVKVTSLSPGGVATDAIPDQFKTGAFPLLNPQDVADAVRFVISTPAHVQIHELTIKAVGEVY